MPGRDHLPLVYDCSGCSNVAQLASRIAVALDRSGIAEMSCIAGVGGDVPPLVKVAESRRPILAVDGCAAADLDALLPEMKGAACALTAAPRSHD